MDLGLIRLLLAATSGEWLFIFGILDPKPLDEDSVQIATSGNQLGFIVAHKRWRTLRTDRHYAEVPPMRTLGGILKVA